MNRVIIGHSNEPDLDGEKHEWLRYKYKDYIFNKEWYVNMEGKYVMGLTVFKLCNEYTDKVPTLEYKGKYYMEIFHSGSCNDLDDDEEINIIEQIRNISIKY